MKFLNSVLLITLLFTNNSYFKKIEDVKGTFIANPIYAGSFAQLKVVKKGSKDTLIYNTDYTGRTNFNLPFSYKNEYFVKISPGKDELTNEEGDLFRPYLSEVNLKPGENGLISLDPIIK